MISDVEMLMGELRIPSPDEAFNLMEKVKEKVKGRRPGSGQ